MNFYLDNSDQKVKPKPIPLCPITPPRHIFIPALEVVTFVVFGLRRKFVKKKNSRFVMIREDVSNSLD